MFPSQNEHTLGPFVKFQFPVDETSLVLWVYHVVQRTWWYCWDIIFLDLSMNCNSCLGTSNYHARQLFVIPSVTWKQFRGPWLLQWRTFTPSYEDSSSQLAICETTPVSSHCISQDRKTCFWVKSLIMFSLSRHEGIFSFEEWKTPLLRGFHAEALLLASGAALDVQQIQRQRLKETLKREGRVETRFPSRKTL